MNRKTKHQLPYPVTTKSLHGPTDPTAVFILIIIGTLFYSVCIAESIALFGTNTTKCNIGPITPFIWLFVDCFVSFSAITYLVFNHIKLHKFDLVNVVGSKLYIFFETFWLCVGYILFLNNCNNFRPDISINMFLATLVIKIVAVGIVIIMMLFR